jgi:hypothetical protein
MQVFGNRTQHDFAILLEDDLEFAPDFFAYIFAFLPYLSDGEGNGTRTVCVSGWNDNGASPSRCHPDHASRTTYFPGLGWALSRGLWSSALLSTWPSNYWLRSQFESRGWSCIVPDLPRVFHFGAGGTNVGADEKAARFDASRLASVDVGVVNWTRVAMHSLSDYADYLSGVLRNATCLESLDDPTIRDMEWDCNVRHEGDLHLESGLLHYILLYNREDYAHQIAASPILKLWPVPRGHYDHVLTLRMTRGRVLHLADKRRSRLLPLHLRSFLSESAALSRAAQGESCTHHCETLGASAGMAYKCSFSELEYANTCGALRSMFTCEQCLYETGADLPAYVVQAADGVLQTAGACLVAETGLGARSRLDCDGGFQWTQRLCVCNLTATDRVYLNDNSRDESSDEL